MKRCSEKCSKFTGEHLYVVVGVGGGGGGGCGVIFGGGEFSGGVEVLRS